MIANTLSIIAIALSLFALIMLGRLEKRTGKIALEIDNLGAKTIAAMRREARRR